MVRRVLALTASGALAVSLASVALAADPNGASGHGAEISAVARAVHTVQGNAHGKAVSAIAKTHGKEVSAAARARAAEKQAAGKANGKANSKANSKPNASVHPNGEATATPDDGAAPTEPGRIKAVRPAQP
ncbi:MAG: hypothetical protein ACJ77F_15315 [Chloroflexota bacterium]